MRILRVIHGLPPAARRATVLAVGVLLLAPPPGPARADQGSPSRSWSSEEAGVKLRFRGGWTVQSEPDSLPLVLREPTGRAVMGLLVEPLGTDDDAGDLEKLTDHSVKAHRDSISKFKIINRRRVEVDDEPATELFFRGKRDGVPYRWIQTLFLSRGKQVFVLYSAPASLFDRYVGDYDELVRSVHKLPS